MKLFIDRKCTMIYNKFKKYDWDLPFSSKRNQYAINNLGNNSIKCIN